MKIRNGFVSNSSSSSFIIAFPRIPLSWKDIRVMMFGNDPEVGVSHPFEDEWYSADTVAQTVFEDLQRDSMIPLDEELILRAFEEDYALDYLDDYFNETDPVKRERLREEADQKRSQFARERSKEFIESNKGYFVYELTYADDEGTYGAALEHGEIFKNLPYIRIDNH